MKKIVFLTIFIFSTLLIYAQRISGGIIFSPMISWMKPDITKQIENQGVKFGFNFGLVGDFNITDNFAFSTGLLADNFGGKLKYLDSIPGFSVDKGSADSVYHFTPGVVIDYKLQYIELPVSLKGKTKEIGYITYFMQAGINPLFKWKAKGNVTQGNISEESIKSEVTSLAFGFHLGAGIEYSLGGSTKVLVEFVYNNGLTDFTKTKTIDKTKNTNDDKVILNHVDLRLGILF